VAGFVTLVRVISYLMVSTIIGVVSPLTLTVIVVAFTTEQVRTPVKRVLF